MNPQPKTKIIRLKGKPYKDLQRRVMERDNWTCQICGEHTEAPPHHIIYRSEGGSDCGPNMCAVCDECHRIIHHGHFLELVPRMLMGNKGKKIVQHILTGILCIK